MLIKASGPNIGGTLDACPRYRKRPFALFSIDEAFDCQFIQCLTNRRPAHTEAIEKLGFGDWPVSHNLSTKDFVPQEIFYLTINRYASVGIELTAGHCR